MKKGFKCTEEMIEQRRSRRIGKKHSEETLEKMRQSARKFADDKMSKMIDKNGPMINENSVQAKTHPDISNTKCWIITHKNMSSGGTSRFALRIWERQNGKKPKGLCLCHKCDSVNGPCCNPQHMFLGTFKENTQDMIQKGRNGKGFTPESRKKAVLTKRKNDSYKISALKMVYKKKIRNSYGFYF